MTEASVPGVEEKAADDATCHLSAAEASAWASGFNEARRALAQILAEKERLERVLYLTRESRVRWFASTMHERRKREAAEAALAGERERCLSAIKAYLQRPDDVVRSDEYMIGFAAGANYTAERNAAAIRAGE